MRRVLLSVAVCSFALMFAPVSFAQPCGSPPCGGGGGGAGAVDPPVITTAIPDVTLTMIAINGVDFGTNPTVSLGDVGGTFLSLTVNSSSDTVIDAVLPVTIAPGTYLLVVDNGAKLGVLDVTIGAVGPQGLPGTDGAQGLPGTDGAQGLPGTDGAQGLPGTDGAQGLPGTDGAQGLPGTDGAQGLPGTDGAQGPQGEPGSAGSTNDENGITTSEFTLLKSIVIPANNTSPQQLFVVPLDASSIGVMEVTVVARNPSDSSMLWAYKGDLQSRLEQHFEQGELPNFSLDLRRRGQQSRPCVL